jgi:hypothetical protein
MIIENGKASSETKGPVLGLYHEQAGVPCVANGVNSSNNPQFGRC